MEFVHLHNHSEYSMLDSACRIPDMIQWTVENSAPAVALTDHGNMFGAWDFYTTAKQAGINPIVGCEVYVAPEHRKKQPKNPKNLYHLTLLAEDVSGYHNLLKLVSLGYIEGFCEKPCIDLEILCEYREGIIALTGCIQGQIPQLLCSNREMAAAQHFKTLVDIMSPRNIYVEIQNHYTDKELKTYPMLVDLAREFEIPLVATNNCHYLSKSDYRIWQILLCIQKKKSINAPDRMRRGNHYYFKSRDEMQVAFRNYPPEAICNTLQIAQRCQMNLDYGKSVMPNYEVPDGYTDDSYLKELCYKGLREKMGGELTSSVRTRLDYELETIRKTGYAGYFLIVWDYIDYANKQGYPLSTRGSAAGSLALYALGVNSFNPMEHGCMFERFLNTERISPPDIDIDFADRIREDVINYLVKKYGHDSVGKVATFSTMGPKVAITDVGKVLDIPIENLKKLTRLVNHLPELTVQNIVRHAPSFKKLVKRPEYKELIAISRELVGLKRHVSSHASAIVVSNGSLSNYMPLFTDKHGQVVTQFEGKTVEDVGIVKFDSLGLRSLTKTDDCVKMVKSNRGKEIKLEDIPFDDLQTYQLVGEGLISGLFQLETSDGMRRLVTELKAETFQDFCAIAAIYRPGPLLSGTTQRFINRKNGREQVKSVHPLLEGTLKDTYGLCIYQEHVMQIARDIAGYTLGEADVLRYAMGRVNKQLLKDQRQKFLSGAIKNGISQKEAETIFDMIEPFGGYAFNKSHSVAYAIVTYRMAYLKAHYPHEFMAAIMTSEADYTPRLIGYRDECRHLAKHLSVDINLLPPDINVSDKYFTVNGNAINFGLIVIKNVGGKAIDAIIAERKAGGVFRSLQDFCERVDTRVVNKRVIESLILCGAFDRIDAHRAKLVANLEKIIKVSRAVRASLARGQLSLFQIDIPLTDTPEYEPLVRFKYEKDLLGFYVSGHPLTEYEDIIKYFTTVNSQTVHEHKLDSIVSIVGMVKIGRVKHTKSSGTTLQLKIEDLEGYVEVFARQEALEKGMSVEKGQFVWIEGKIRNMPRGSKGKTTTEKRIYASRIMDITAVTENLTSAVEVKIAESDINNIQKLKALQDIALANSGDLYLILRLASPRFGDVIVRCGMTYKIANDDTVFKQVNKLFGENSIKRSNRTHRFRGV